MFRVLHLYQSMQWDRMAAHSAENMKGGCPNNDVTYFSLEGWSLDFFYLYRNCEAWNHPEMLLSDINMC